MAKTYVPSSDAEFGRWLAGYTKALAAHYAEVGLSDADAQTLEALKTLWDEKFAANNAAWVAAKGCAAAKSDVRKAIEQVLGSQVPRIQAYEGTSDELRRTFGLKLKDSPTTPAAGVPVEVAPKVHVDINKKLMHQIVIQTDVTSGDRRWKPIGTMGCEIYRKFGEKPTGPRDMELVMMTAKGKVVLNYSGEDGGKTVHYMMRYVTRDGETGPWSDVKSVPVAA